MGTNGETEIEFQVRESKTALVCGVLAIGFAIFILLLRMFRPSAGGGGAFLYVPLLCMVLGGVLCLMLYCNRSLTVRDRKICYVNYLQRERRFTLDEIGFCKMEAAGNEGRMVLCDLCGNKLCKLDFGMRGMAEFYQYLLDNGVETAWDRGGAVRHASLAAALLALGRETSVCAEEIRGCAERFYEDAERAFRAWEARNERFEAVWEIGFAEYAADDTSRRCRPWERESSVSEEMREIPESYECVLEAYLKRKDGYVVDSRGEAVMILLPYLARTRSYRIGEKTRIRKTDEQSLQEWLEGRLALLARELPRRRYHTETFALRHRLRPSAGLRERP